ncbi:Amino acid/polyamine transporter I [Penicillium bovifimosum]|uniref:Amino acid/polyamine transporter I n=1 Tax=Penicillium bovifimosum TaxID=126998 RepID=A0A9W9GNQ2_9EURO|nr:Amino acid/polyamine transporter I [Penicillium bovifimosum]KAJ5124382.1 Amino acid/polyamine transporter I [Penicillium bovifimosum]
MERYEMHPLKRGNVRIGNGDLDGVAISFEPPIKDSSKEQEASPKRLFNFTQIFFFSLTYLSSWETQALNLSTVLSNGGPEALAWGIVIVVFGAMAQSASLAEMASMQPIAGAQYHWTNYLAPPSQKKFITWMQGWVTWFAWISVLAGVANTTATMIQGLASANYPEYEPESWHITLIIIGMLVVESLMNMYTFWLIPWIEMLAGILHICLLIVFLVVFTTLGTRHKPEFVFSYTESSSGWAKFPAWNIGLLTPVWGFVGFDGAVHMSEEVRRAKQAVPRSIFYTVVTNGILAYAMVICMLFTMGSVEQAQKARFPIIEICQQATGSVKAATAMVSGLLIISLSVNLASIASVSRLTWAWARDGALPRWFAYIDRRHNVPIRAVWLPVLIVMVLACLNIADGAAFGAFVALGSIGLFVSYFIAIGCMVHNRLQKNAATLGDWNMGVWGLPVNVFALVYTAWVTVWLAFPSALPVTGENMNYAAPIFGVSTLFAFVYWLIKGKHRWEGLNKEVVRLAVEGGELQLK